MTIRQNVWDGTIVIVSFFTAFAIVTLPRRLMPAGVMIRSMPSNGLLLFALFGFQVPLAYVISRYMFPAYFSAKVTHLLRVAYVGWGAGMCLSYLSPYTVITSPVIAILSLATGIAGFLPALRQSETHRDNTTLL